MLGAGLQDHFRGNEVEEMCGFAMQASSRAVRSIRAGLSQEELHCLTVCVRFTPLRRWNDDQTEKTEPAGTLGDDNMRQRTIVYSSSSVLMVLALRV